MFRVLFLLFIALFSVASSAESTVNPNQQSLSSHPYWLKLGHYRSTLMSSWESEIDSEDFFAATTGKTDPLAEFNETLALFRQYETNLDAYNIAVCRFPARFRWLKTKLAESWPAVDCKEMQAWRDIIQPKGMTLVFPTAFMNNPSSMFGHTLLRVDAKDQTRNKELVAFAINFAAIPDNQDGAATYAFKGLTGQYPGGYALMPYYQKVREYNDLESRDMWEYKLNLNEAEVNNVLLHLWELKDTRFDYYFIDENCSYQLLSLLQVAREGLTLSEQFDYHVIPSDTVAVLRDQGLLNKPNYRPASGTKLLHYATQLSLEELAASKLAMQGIFPDKQLSDTARAKIYEMAYEWLNYQFYDERLDRAEIAPLLTRILIERSKLKVKSVFTDVTEPAVSPEQGHGSARIGFGVKGYKHDNNAVFLNWRLNYHDLFDDPAGFIPGAQISFFDTELSASEFNKAQVDRFYFLDAFALPVDNLVFDSWSWNARAGFDRQPDNGVLSSRWFAQSGYGKSWGDANNLQSYALASTELVNGAVTYRRIEVGAGIEAGLIWQMNADHRVGLQANQMYLLDSDVDYHTKANITWHWAPNRYWSLRAESGYLRWRGEEAYTRLNWLYYF